MLTYERFFALVFNEIEKLYDTVQSGNLEHLYELYYKLWLHADVDVTIEELDGEKKRARIIGIDDFGYLKVQTTGNKIKIVHPDGNTFDMLRGLIVPK